MAGLDPSVTESWLARLGRLYGEAGRGTAYSLARVETLLQLFEVGVLVNELECHYVGRLCVCNVCLNHMDGLHKV